MVKDAPLVALVTAPLEGVAEGILVTTQKQAEEMRDGLNWH